MRTLAELLRAKSLCARCPYCGETFALQRARLFDATKPFPDYALKHLKAEKTRIAADRLDLRKRRARLSQRSFTSAASSGVGQRLEMLTASLRGLPVVAADCRSLFKPIDYISFAGASKGRVESIRFIEVKTGRSRLTNIQRAIKSAVEGGAVTLRVANHELPIG